MVGTRIGLSGHKRCGQEVGRQRTHCPQDFIVNTTQISKAEISCCMLQHEGDFITTIIQDDKFSCKLLLQDPVKDLIKRCNNLQV
jgi:hypothetical protein